MRKIKKITKKSKKRAAPDMVSILPDNFAIFGFSIYDYGGVVKLPHSSILNSYREKEQTKFVFEKTAKSAEHRKKTNSPSLVYLYQRIGIENWYLVYICKKIFYVSGYDFYRAIYRVKRTNCKIHRKIFFLTLQRDVVMSRFWD